MAYIDVLTLDETKNYLNVDDTLTLDDSMLTQMINTALRYVEKRTNVLVYARDKEYVVMDYFRRVYDSPINSLISPTDATIEIRQNYSNYNTTSIDDTVLTLNVGHVLPTDVPDLFRQFALQYVKYMYYEAETEKANNGKVPMWLDNMLGVEERFLI
jgi:hypothetical protein